MIEVVAGVARDKSWEIVRAAAACGATVEETAAEFGCSEATARRLWRDLALSGQPPRGRRRRVPGTLGEVEQELRAGRTVAEVALASGVKRWMIRDLAQHFGIVVAATPRNREAESKRIGEARIIRAAAARGATIAEAAAEMGCSPARARRIWHELGVPMERQGRRYTRAYVAEVERELRAGRTAGEVARARGVSAGAIRDMAQRHGFPLQARRRPAG
jgi:transposase-like protein